MNARERARQWIEEQNDLAYYVNLLEILRRPETRVLYAGERGVVLYEAASDGYYFALREGAEELALIPDEAANISGYGLWAKPVLERRFRALDGFEAYSLAWTRPEVPALPDFGGELRLLDRSWAPWLAEHYSSNFGGVPYMEGAVDRGILGAFVEGRPAGFIGYHPEGAMGMLEVLPEYRRRGIGAALETGAIRLALERGSYAFCQVKTDNARSLALQHKLGLEQSERTLFWMFMN